MESQATPSKVLHFRNVPQHATEQDLVQAVQSFGKVAHVVVMGRKGQALVEMAEVKEATNAVAYFASVQCAVAGQSVDVQFSTHQALNRRSQEHAQPNFQEAAPNHILLVTVHDCVYPITIEVVHQVFSMHGQVQKVVIFNKPIGVQVLVQYTRLESACQAHDALQGQHIYAGVCRLEIQFSKLADLTVTRNGDRSRDFANPSLPVDQPALLPTPADGKQGGGGGGGAGGGGAASPGLGPHPSLYDRSPFAGSALPPSFPPANPYAPNAVGFNDGQDTVLLVSNLHPDKTTCLSLFNLFSLYGNIVRIKRLYNKPDQALLQMEDATHAAAALANLKGAVVFGKAISVAPSRHRFINPGPNPNNDPSPEEAEELLSVGFTHSRMNRFRGSSAGKASRHAYPPSATLHLSNLPDGVTEEELVGVFSRAGKVVGTKMFEASGHQMCLMQFDSVEAATDVLCAMHNKTVGDRSVRLAFSRSSIAA